MFMRYLGGGVGHLGQPSSHIHWQASSTTVEDEDEMDTEQAPAAENENSAAEGSQSPGVNIPGPEGADGLAGDPGGSDEELLEELDTEDDDASDFSD